VLWVLVGLLAGSAVIAWVLVFELLRKYGGLLLRFDRLEERLMASGLQGFQADGVPDGVAPGTPFPPFRLAEIQGGRRTLDDYRGRRVLMVHWSAGCGFCDMIAPDLAEAVPQLRERNTELVLVTSGDPEANLTLAREHGLDCPMLLENQSDRVEGFAGVGTPAAYLLDEEGRVERGLVVGADKVPDLLRAALEERSRSSRLPLKIRPLSESRLERNGLRAGTVAPPFTLPGIDGRPVSLTAYRGRRVLVVFSDPHCGPCQELAPELARRHDEGRRAGLAVVMVSRGTLEENQAKCKEHGIDFDVGLQHGWRVSREYGIFATPVAFLVDEDGVIARDVAKGPDEVLALLRASIRDSKGGAITGAPAPVAS
jgi:peroxiredoxin